MAQITYNEASTLQTFINDLNAATTISYITTPTEQIYNTTNSARLLLVFKNAVVGTSGAYSIKTGYGYSASSVLSTLITGLKPYQPGGLTATPSNTQLTVVITPPVDSLSLISMITGYRWQYVLKNVAMGASWTDISGTSFTITGLVNYTEYDIYAQSKNASGYSTNTTKLAAVTPYTNPFPPTLSLPATTAQYSISTKQNINITAPTTGTSFITGYRWQVVLKDAAIGTAWTDTTATSFQATGLTDWTVYDYYVQSKNSIGYSTSAKLTFMCYAVNWPETTLQNYINDLGASNWLYTTTQPAPSAEYFVSGPRYLYNSARFLLIYYNAIQKISGAWSFKNGYVGTDTFSAAIALMTPAPPSALATSADSQLTVTITAPVDTSTFVNMVSGYRWQYVLKNAAIGTSWTDITGTSFTITGLTNYTAYDVYIQSRNASGYSTTSTKLAAVTPYPAPLPPTLSMLGTSLTTFTINITPATTGSAYITGYRWQAVLQNASPGTSWTNITGTTFQATGLSNYTYYDFYVQSKNVVGYSTSAMYAGGIVGTSGLSEDTINGLRGGFQAGNIAIRTTQPGPAPEYVYNTYSNLYVTNSDRMLLVAKNALQIVSGLWTYKAPYTATTTFAAAIATMTPAPPSALLVLPADTQLTVTITPPVDTSALINLVKGYRWQYVLKDAAIGTSWTNISGTSFIITGLNNNTAYDIYVQSNNIAGYSTSSTKVSAKPSIPSAPSTLAATPASTQLTVAITAPTDSSIVTGYRWQYVLQNGTPGTSWTDISGTTSFVVTGLTTYTAYDILVQSKNVVGYSATSTKLTATPYPVPPAPAALAATPGSTQLTVNATPDATGSSFVTGYRWQYVLQNGTPGTSWTGVSGTSSFVVTGLTNYTLYDIYVQAQNVVGYSATSTKLTAKPYPVPSPPSALVATPASTQLTINISPPTDLSIITGYRWQCVTQGGSLTSSWTEISGTTFVITGLTDYTAYDVYVQAMNIVGYSATSTQLTTSPYPVPSAPSALSSVPDNTKLTVTITPPTDSSVVAGYRWQYVLQNETPGTLWTDITGTSFDVTGLTDYITYDVYVQSVNIVGYSVTSTKLVATPYGTPFAPAELTSTPASTQLTVNITPPTVGANFITGYRWKTQNTSWTDITGTSSFVITGLTNYATYNISVQSRNIVGYSNTSTNISATPYPAPSPPSSLQSVAGNTQVAVTIQPPSDASVVTGYKWQVLGLGDSISDTWNLTSSTTFNVMNLTNYTSYHVYVEAYNVVGSSSFIYIQVLPYPPPSPPLSLASTPSSQQIAIVITPPNDNSIISGYRWQYSLLGDSQLSALTNTSSPNFTVTNLQNYASYTIYVETLNSVGDSDSTTITVMPYPSPSSPASTDIVTYRSHEVDISVTRPTDQSIITGYMWQTVLKDAAITSVWNSSSSTLFTVSSLENGIEYDLYTKCFNNVGESLPIKTAIMASTVPGQPTNVSYTPGNHTISLNLSIPDNGGKPVTSFNVSTDGGVTFFNIATATTPVLITKESDTNNNLINGKNYSIVVNAGNINGSGVNMNPLVAIPSTIPSAPILTQLVPDESQLSVYFTLVSDDSGTPVTNISYKLDDGPYILANTTSSPFVITGLTTLQTYSVTLKSVNINGSGAESNVEEMIVTPKPSKLSITLVERTLLGYKLRLEWIDNTPVARSDLFRVYKNGELLVQVNPDA